MNNLNRNRICALSRTNQIRYHNCLCLNQCGIKEWTQGYQAEVKQGSLLSEGL